MFGRLPRYDDTFGVRMDLGAQREDPIAMRPPSRLQVKETLVFETRRPASGWFGQRETDPLTALRMKPVQAPRPVADKPAAPATRTAPRQGSAEPGPRSFWQRLSIAQRIGLSVFAGWFLLATGLWVVAFVVAVVWLTQRKRAR